MRRDEQAQAAANGGKEGRIFSKVLNVPYTALVAAATSQIINLDDALPSDAVVLRAFFDLITDFAAPVASALKVDVGISGNDDVLLDALELLASNPTNTRRQGLTGDTSTHEYLAGKQLIATFTATGANLGNGTVTTLTAGEVEIQVLYTRIARIGATAN
jgi:hypothetical protein